MNARPQPAGPRPEADATRGVSGRQVNRRTALAIGAAAGLTAAVGAGASPASAASTSDPVPGGIYPQGERFGLGWYDIGAERPAGDVPDPEDPHYSMSKEHAAGFKIAHRYMDTKFDPLPPSYLDLAASEHMGVLATLPPVKRDDGKLGAPSEALAKQYIDSLSGGQRAVWWNLPEEMRYWYANEMKIITSYAERTRAYDPRQRPNYMYLPNNYSASAISHYVPYLDIIPVSAYTTYVQRPHAWARWKISQGVQGVAQAGAHLGPDYLNGERTVVGVLELYHHQGNPWMTPAGAYHDFWAAIAEGAQGIMIYSYYRRNGGPALIPCLEKYNQAATELVSTPGLEHALLRGERVDDLLIDVVSGPTTAPPFIPQGWKQPVVIPSIAMLTVRSGGWYYAVIVNSADSPVRVKLSGPGLDSRLADLPIERQHLPVQSGAITLDLDPLGVKVVRIAHV